MPSKSERESDVPGPLLVTLLARALRKPLTANGFGSRLMTGAGSLLL